MPIVDDGLELLPLFPGETEDAIWARWQAWANEGLSPEDTENWTSTREGDMFQTLGTGGVREAARGYDVMGTEMVSAGFPKWTYGEYADDWAESVKLERDPAVPATGEVTFVADPGTVIPVGTTVGTEGTVEGGGGQEYATTEDATVGNLLGAPVGLGGANAAGGGLAASHDYYYVVTGLNAEGETLHGAEVHVATTVGNKTVNLDWTDLAGATGYNVYRGDVAGGPYYLVTEVAGSAYVDDGSDIPGGTNPPAEDTTGARVTIPVEAITAGSAGNVPALAVSLLESAADVSAVSNADAIGGGADAETDEALRVRLEERFGGSGPGNKRDYEAWVRSIGAYGQITVVPRWNGPGTVLVVVMDTEGQPLAPAEIDRIQNFLDPDPGMAEGQAPSGATVTVMTGVFENVTAAATVEFELGYSLDGAGNTVALRDAIEASLADYFALVKPGEEVVLAQVEARIVQVPGVHDVGSVELNGAAANVALTSNPPQVVAMQPSVLTEGAVP